VPERALCSPDPLAPCQRCAYNYYETNQPKPDELGKRSDMEQQDERKQDDLVYTVREVAARLKIGPGTLYSLIAKGQFPHLKFGRKIMVSQKQLQAFLSGGAVR
jgi:excisionase family DNA binding protein